MVGVLLSIIIVVLMVALTLWAIGYLAQGQIPTTPYRAIVVLVIAVGVAALIYAVQHPFLRF